MDKNTKDYKYLYVKYKNKYLKLKKQTGSAIQVHNKFLPCEIVHYTNTLYISSNRYRLIQYIQELIASSGIHVNIVPNQGSGGFSQDPYILLKDGSNNFAVKVSSNVTYLDDRMDIINCYTKYFNGNHYGGNYISSPTNIIFTFDNSDHLKTCINRYLIDPIISLHCSFTSRRERHIDETMCFMPYGIGLYKIWFYIIRNIKWNHHVFGFLKVIQDLDMKATNIKFTNLKTNHVDNYHEIDDMIILDLPIIKNKLTPQEVFLLQQQYFQLENPTLEIIRERLEKERLDNLNIISNTLFGTRYNINIGKFVEFPIDLTIEGIQIREGTFYFDFKISNIPIFNRILIENELGKYCIFSTGPNIDPTVQSLLDVELPNVKSYIDDGVFNINYYNTSEYNNEGIVGGNLHCLVKNQY